MKRLAFVVLLVACGKKAEEPAKAVAPTTEDAAMPTPSTQSKLTFTHDGVTTPMTSAVAVRWQDDSIHVLVANHEITCDEALNSMRVGVPHDDVGFSAGVSKRLAPDGTFAWQLTSYSFAHSPEDGELAPAQVKGDAVAGKTIEVSFAYKQVKGTIVAQVCGDRPIEKDHPAIAKAPHPSTATITIAGQKVPIVSAWRFEYTTYLSSEPITCAYAGLPTRVTFVRDAQVGANGNWTLSGGWLAGYHSTVEGGFTVTDGAHGDSPDGPTVQLTLGGAATIDGYKVELAGTIEALACKART